jgi:putative DNA primase/helicase
MTDEIESTPAAMPEHKAFEKGRQRGKKAKPKPTPTPADKNAPDAAQPTAKADPTKEAGFFCDDQGLWYIGSRSTKEGTVCLPAVWVCAPILVKWRMRKFDGTGWRFIIEISNRDGNVQEVTLLDSEIGGQDGAWHKALADAGLRIHPKRRGELAQFLLMDCDDAARARGVETTGWFGNVFVMPHLTIGTAEEPVIYQGQDRSAVSGESGTPEEWREHVGRLCAGNSRLTMSVCAALAASILPFSGIGESGGFHLFGASSTGKTTAEFVASSLNGLPASCMQTWRNTGNAIEGTAAKHNHRLLCLDEIREAAEKEVGLIVMMLAHGSGKGRMKDTAVLRERLTWLLLWLSTGEHGLMHYMEAAGLKPDPGMEVRQLDIPADAGAGRGLFEKLHDHKDARAFAENLRTACDQYHGAVGIAWLEHVSQHLDEIRRDLPGEVARVAKGLTPEKSESQVMRAVRRFALLAVAGEYATKWGLTGWEPGESTAGIRKCVQAWINHRGGSENLEERRIYERFRDFIGKGWSGRFIHTSRADDTHAPGKDQTVGFRDDQRFYITPEGWKEIFRGMDPARAGQVLLDKKMLQPGNWVRAGKTEVRPYRREKLPGGMGRRQCYVTEIGVFDLLDVAQCAGEAAPDA